MYLRPTARRNTDGSVVRYLQLAHNTWDPQAKRSRVQVLYNFGREDANNRAALQRLVASVSRFLDPDQALAAQAGEGLGFVESRPLGGAWALDGLWHRLGIDTTMRRLPKGSDAAAAEDVTGVGFRSYGHSKDHRDDLPQIVVGMAVTRTGIPVRVWCWPGNTSDQA